jgi:coenzyme Q-binding protein COQ10
LAHFANTRRVPHAAGDMFDLVADVGAYPEFVPLMRSMVVQTRTTEGEREILLARMTVAYSILHESFTSRVTLDRPAMRIDVAAVDGPFKRLENQWRFEPDGPNACKVHFTIDYEFRSRALGLLFGIAFDRAFRRYQAAFEARADAVYGKPGA